MIRSSACLAADDVSIRCRVRRSPFATNPQFGEAREMTCTMRNWHPHHYSKQDSSNSIMDGSGHSGSSSNNKSNHRRSHSQGQNNNNNKNHSHGMPPPYRRERNHSPPGASNPQSKTSCAVPGDSHHNTGPELLMTPIHDILTNRDASPIRPINHLRQQRPRAASVGRAGSRGRSKSADYKEKKKLVVDPGMDHSYHSHHQQQQCHYHDTADNTVDATASFSIPLHDIVVVEAKKPSSAAQHRSSSRNRSGRRNSVGNNNNSKSHCLLLTTMENGYLEFCCPTSNGHDVLQAFLQASIAPERMIVHGEDDADNRSIPSAASSSMSACMDVDRLTTQQIKVSQETWPQRFQRRVGKVVHTISEVSETLCDYANCCREAGTPGVPGSSPVGSPTSESRDMPPPPSSPSSSAPSSTRSTLKVPFFGTLEMVDDDVASLQAYYQSAGSRSRNYPHNNPAEKDKHAAGSFSRKSCRLPSGLSVEPDPALETMYHAN